MAKTARTFAEIARHFGVSESMVGYWYRQAGCPIRKGKSTDLDKLAAWKATWDAERPAKVTDDVARDVRKLKVQLLKAKVAINGNEAIRRKLRREHEERKLVRIDHARAVVAGYGQRIRTLLLPLSRSLAPQLVGLDVHELEAELARAIRVLLEQMAQHKTSADLADDPELKE